MSTATPSFEQTLRAAYTAFNARDIDAVFRTMVEDVDWPNGMEGGRVHGYAEVRAYWTRQWQILDPHVEPVSFRVEPEGRTAIQVHQVVRDIEGKLLVDQMLEHIYTSRDGRIASMEIRTDPSDRT